MLGTVEQNSHPTSSATMGTANSFPTVTNHKLVSQGKAETKPTAPSDISLQTKIYKMFILYSHSIRPFCSLM